MPSCLHCTKETKGERCACCPSTHYCSKDCQKADWHAVHKYEQYFYKLGAAGDNDDARPKRQGDTISFVDREAEEKKRHPAGGAAMIEEITAERQEYDRLASLIRQYVANRTLSKKEKAMTQEQREEMKRRVETMFVVDPAQQRAERRNKFIDNVVQLIEGIGEVPSSGGDENTPGRIPTLDQEALGYLGALFRKQDVLHLKRVYALATKRREDQDEASRYESLVSEEEARFIHRLLFGDDGDSANVMKFAETRRKVREMEREGLVEECGRKIMEDAVAHTADIYIEYLKALDEREEEKRTAAQYGMKIGKPARSKKAVKENQENTINMVEARANDEVDGYTEDSFNNVGDVILGATDAQTNRARDEGLIDKETCDASQGFAHTLFSYVRAELFKTAVLDIRGAFFSWEYVSGYAAQFWERVRADNKLDDRWLSHMKLNISWKGFFSIMFTVVLFTMAITLFGYKFFSDPMSPEVRTQVNTLNQMAVNMNATALTLGAMQLAVNQTGQVIQGYREILNGTTATREFLHLPANDTNIDIDTITNRVMVNSSLTGLLQEVNRRIGIEEARIAKDLAKGLIVKGRPRLESTLQTLKLARENIQLIFESPTLNEARVHIEDLQSQLQTFAELSSFMGSTVLVEQVKQILDHYEKFADVMGLKVKDLGELLNDQSINLETMRGAVETQREKILKSAAKSHVLGSLVKKIGDQFGVLSQYATPMVEAACVYAVYSLTGDRLMHAFYPFAAAERLYHNISEQAGVYTNPSWMSSSVNMMYQPDYTWMWIYALAAYSMYFTTWMSRAANTTGRATIRWIGERIVDMCGKKFNTVIDETDPDYKKAAETLKNINDIKGDEKKYSDVALRNLVNGDLTSRQHGIVTALMMKEQREKVADARAGDELRPANVWMNTVATRIDTVGALIRAIGVACRVALFFDYYHKMIALIYHVLSIMLSANGLVGLAVVLGAMAFIGFDINKHVGRDPLTHLFAKADALFRIVAYPTWPKMIVVNFLYATLGGDDLSLFANLSSANLSFGNLTFAAFASRVAPDYAAEQTTVREVNESLANTTANYSNATRQVDGLVNQTTGVVDNVSWHMNQTALIAKGTVSEVEQLQETINKVRRQKEFMRTNNTNDEDDD